MRILLTNDDGIDSRGLQALYKAVKSLGEVTIVAPEVEQSAIGHAISLSQPLRVAKRYSNGDFYGYAVSGTPADCVKLAINTLLNKRPDLVISGINLGPNVGISVLYSGTVCGATEGAILGIPAFAISLATYTKPDFAIAADFAKEFALTVKKYGIPKHTLLNVNVPALGKRKIKGVAVSKMGINGYEESYEKRLDPRKRTYYWLTGGGIKAKGTKEVDVIALEKGYITLTPIHYDMTNYPMLNYLRKWKIKI
ncbi:MAG: 5'/3'-nucleotidase SurE [Candidatus Omnitrophota bacterium]